MTAEKNHAESRAQVLQLREAVASLELAVSQRHAEVMATTEAKEGVARQLRAAVEDKAEVEARLQEKIAETESLQALQCIASTTGGRHPARRDRRKALGWRVCSPAEPSRYLESK